MTPNIGIEPGTPMYRLKFKLLVAYYNKCFLNCASAKRVVEGLALVVVSASYPDALGSIHGIPQSLFSEFILDVPEIY